MLMPITVQKMIFSECSLHVFSENKPMETRCGQREVSARSFSQSYIILRLMRSICTVLGGRGVVFTEIESSRQKPLAMRVQDVSPSICAPRGRSYTAKRGVDCARANPLMTILSTARGVELLSGINAANCIPCHWAIVSVWSLSELCNSAEAPV